MSDLGRKHSKRGDQGRLPSSDKYGAMGQAKPEARDRIGVLEESSQGLQLPPISRQPQLEDMIGKQESRSRAMNREDQQFPHGRVEKKPFPAADYVSQKPQSSQAAQTYQAQGQNEPRGGSACPQLPLANPTEAEPDLQSQSRDIIAVPEMIHSHKYNTDTSQSYSRQQFSSDFTSDARETPRDTLSKKSGLGAKIKKAGLEVLHSFPQEEKIHSDRKRLEKESPARKRREDASHDQKKLPPNPPTSFPTQPRSGYPQPIARTSNGRSEVPLARHNSSRHKSRTLRQESPPLGIEVECGQGSNSTIASRSEEEINPHAWERHLPQSVDDATIQREVLTLFEFIEHHVDDYYCDTQGRISPNMVEQLTGDPSPCLPDGTSLGELFERARYKAPIIKHCLISIVVSGMSFRELPLFPLLPEEFTVLPRALRKETVDRREKLYYNQAFSKFRSICAFLRPHAQQDPEYVRELNATISRAVALCSEAFAPWEARDSAPHKRREHLTSLFHKAARVGILIFSQSSTFIFDWDPLQKANSTSTIQVWPQLLRTTNHNAEPLPRPQLIVEGLSQDIGVEMITSHSSLRDSEVLAFRRAPDPTNHNDAYGMTLQGNHFAHPAQSGTSESPSELPAPQGFVSATVQGPHNPSYLPIDGDQSDRRDRSPGHRKVRRSETSPNQYTTQSHSAQADQQPRHRESQGRQHSPLSHSPSKSSVQQYHDPGHGHIHGSQIPPCIHSTPPRSAQRDQELEFRNSQDTQKIPYIYPALKDPQQKHGNQEYHGAQPKVSSQPNRAPSHDTYNVNTQTRAGQLPRKPVGNTQVEYQELPTS